MPTPTRARQQTLANPSPNCPHCRSTRLKLLLGFRGQQTFRCQNCQGYFNIPAHPTDRFYTSSYYEKIYAARKTAQLEQSRRYLRIIRRHAPRASILDYGCGTGVFLVAAHEAGFVEVAGADISADALKCARDNLQDRARLIDLNRDALPSGRFAVIALLDALSALPDARTVLERLRDRHLAEGGLVAIRTPHIPPAYFAVVRALALLIGKKQASRLLFAENRYALFDVDSLQRFLEALGFEPVFVEIGQDYPRLDGPKNSWSDHVWVTLHRILRRPTIFVLARVRAKGTGASKT